MNLKDLKHSELMELCKEHKKKYHGQSKEAMIAQLEPLFAVSKDQLKQTYQEALELAHSACMDYYREVTKGNRAAFTLGTQLNKLRELKEQSCNLKY